MSQRVVRLVSAGIPLSSAFQAAVEEIIDSGGSAPFENIQRRVEEVMRFKENRIIREAGWRTWTDFTKDITEQLLDINTLSYINGRYYAPEFVKGAEYSAIPTANPKVMFAVWDEATRTQRDADARDLMDAVRIYADIEKLLDRGMGNPSALEYVKKAERAMFRAKQALRGDVSHAPEHAGTVTSGHGKKRRTGVREGVEAAYLEYAARDVWFTSREPRLFWNAHNPDQEPLGTMDAGPITHKLNKDWEAGRLERRGPNGSYEYRVK
jgi:hypothetical protein